MDDNDTIGEDSIDQMHLGQFLKQLPTILFGHIVAVTVCTYLLIGRVDGGILSAWVIAFGIILCCRAGMYFHHTNNPTNRDNYRSRIRWHAVASGGLGALCGGLAFILLGETSSITTILIVLVLASLVASAVAPTANLQPVFYSFTLLTLLPAVLKFILLGGSDNWFWAVWILLFLFFTRKFASGAHLATKDAIRFRYNNIQLIENLKLEKLHAEESQKNAESSLEHAETANHAKTQFLAAASHDLRQPLHALRLLSATLENTELHPQQVPIVEKISASVHSLEELLNSLLDVSKLDAGTQSVSRETLYLSDIFDNLQRNHSSVAEHKGVKFRVEHNNALVHTDPILLERLLSNLISNAITYSPKGTVTVSTHLKMKHCVIRVQDTGVGIREVDQERIFDEFVQLDNPERDRSKGIGLGLAIVKRTALLLDLPLELISSPGQGSIFSLTVPLGTIAPNLTKNISTIESNQDVGGMLVLVIDDETSVRTALEVLLETWGCAVICAGNGEEAEEIIRAIDSVPDAIVADLRLRDNETGVDVIERIHSVFDEQCPALIITGDIAPTTLRQIKNSPYPILHKPCDPQELRKFLSISHPNNR